MPNVYRTLTRLRDMDDVDAPSGAGDNNKAYVWDNTAGKFVLVQHLTQTQGDARYLQLTGGTLSGALYVDHTIRSRQTGATRYRTDLSVDSAIAYLQSYDDTGSAYIPIRHRASSIIFQPNGSDAAYFNSDGHLLFSSGKRVDVDQVRALASTGLALNDSAGLSCATVRSGRLGVVTTNPLTPLHVGSGADTVVATGAVIVGQSAGVTTFAVRNTTDAMECLFMASTDSGHFGTATNGELRFRTNNTVRCRIGASGSFSVGNISPAISDGVGLDVDGRILRLRTAKTPASASATGNAGEVCWDSSYIYVCTATNTWRRIAHATW